MANGTLDVMIGGGSQYWYPEAVNGSRRTDQLDLLALAAANGIDVLRGVDAFRALDAKSVREPMASRAVR